MTKLTRQDLQNLRRSATELAGGVTNEGWQRAYLRLADAANCLDAMEARTVIQVEGDNGHKD